MDLTILKKKISTYRSEGGKLRRVPDELLGEILPAWEAWTGSSSGFYDAVGVDFRKMAALIGRAKKLKREGHFPESNFKEIKLEGSPQERGSLGSPCGIELSWDQGKVIRFSQVEQLVDFLKKVA
jgi:hypothetical protein